MNIPDPPIAVIYNEHGSVRITVGNPGNMTAVSCKVEPFCLFFYNTWWPMDKRIEYCINRLIMRYFTKVAFLDKSWSM